MAPVSWAGAIAERVQLIEKVVIAFVINRTVWIVHPLGRGSDVELRMRWVGLGTRYGGLHGGCRSGDDFVGWRGRRAGVRQWNGKNRRGSDAKQVCHPNWIHEIGAIVKPLRARVDVYRPAGASNHLTIFVGINLDRNYDYEGDGEHQ
jgi:hypothetical protein